MFTIGLLQVIHTGMQEWSFKHSEDYTVLVILEKRKELTSFFPMRAFTESLSRCFYGNINVSLWQGLWAGFSAVAFLYHCWDYTSPVVMTWWNSESSLFKKLPVMCAGVWWPVFSRDVFAYFSFFIFAPKATHQYQNMWICRHYTSSCSGDRSMKLTAVYAYGGRCELTWRNF